MLSPIILWFRRDLRLVDHPALTAAIETGRPIIPLFICDPLVEKMGAAPKWRLGLSLAQFAKDLSALSSRLVLRRGDAKEVLDALVQETGADAVYWSRDYAPGALARDTEIKAGLLAQGISVLGFSGQLLFEPWVPKTQAGTEFKVYSPFWRAVSRLPVDAPFPKPAHLPNPQAWPHSETRESWDLGQGMQRGEAIVSRYVCVGAEDAQARLERFVEDRINRYKQDRDFPQLEATSRLSENLTYGEISPRQIWHAGQSALAEGAQGAEHFLKELVWREFAYHLSYHFPDLATRNWRKAWDGFPWQRGKAALIRWQRGQTGVELVDAAMRELYVTGTMHNRLRMIAASYLTKHLMIDWRCGLKWFEDTLIDWDPAANAMGWQWVAGCGPDAAPYFRVFNPDGQAQKFDASGTFRNRFLNADMPEAAAFYDAIPKGWGMSPDDPPVAPMMSLAQGRERALSAYARFREAPVQE